MKKNFVLLVILLTVLSAQAKDHNVVIKGDFGQSGSHTEVFVGGDDGTSDTISVVPAVDVTTICMIIKDKEGNVVEQQTVSASDKNMLTITSALLLDGYYIEIVDDYEVIYRSFEVE